MSTIFEIPGSGRSGGNEESPTWEFRYQIDGVADDVTARWAVLATAPGTYQSLIRDSVDVEPIGPETWEATVRYVARKPETGQIEFSSEISTESGNITQSKETVHTYAVDGFTAPDFKGAIGVSRSGNELHVAGCEVDLPVLNFRIKLRADPASVTQEYWSGVYAIKCAPINDDTFFGFDAGEVKFRGATGGWKQGDTYTELEFQFSASPNKTDLAIGDIEDIAKGGWEYLWVYRMEELDEDSGLIVTIPKAVYIERVYDDSDFSDLGLT